MKGEDVHQKSRDQPGEWIVRRHAPLTQGRSRASARSSGNTDTDREDVLNTDVFR